MQRLWHNPRCSKSRQTLALLEERGVEVELFHYIDTPPDAAMLDGVLTKMGVKAAALVARRGEKVWKDLGLSTDSTDAEVRAAMLAHPILIERPIYESDTRAVIGRPPEAVLDLL